MVMTYNIKVQYNTSFTLIFYYTKPNMNSMYGETVSDGWLSGTFVMQVAFLLWSRFWNCDLNTTSESQTDYIAISAISFVSVKIAFWVTLLAYGTLIQQIEMERAKRNVMSTVFYIIREFNLIHTYYHHISLVFS